MTSAPVSPLRQRMPACTCCGGRMRIVETFRRGHAPRTAGVAQLWADSS